MSEEEENTTAVKTPLKKVSKTTKKTTKKQVQPTTNNTFRRNSDGLIEGINYVYKENGLISWPELIDNKYFFPNPDRTDETDVSKCSYEDLVIKLPGLEYIARLRGIKSVEYRPIAADPNYFATVCRITWIPNFETNWQEQVSEQIATVVPETCNDLTINYLGEICSNRAFCRCVRRFLEIVSVSQEEIASKGSPAKKKIEQISKKRKQSNGGKDISPIGTLKKVVSQYNTNISQIREWLQEKEIDPNTIETLDDVPGGEAFFLIDKIKSKK